MLMLTKIALRNVVVHWRQSLAALLSIAGAFFSFVLFQGYIIGSGELYKDAYSNRVMYGDLIIENSKASDGDGRRNPWNYSLSSQDQVLIKSLLEKRSADIETQVRFLTFQGIISTGTASRVFLAQAYDIESGAQMRAQWKWNTLYGQPLYLATASHPLVLGKSLAYQLGCDIEKKVNSSLPDGGYLAEVRPFQCARDEMQISVTTPQGNLNAMDFRVVGLMDAGYRDVDSRYVSLSLPLAQQLLSTDKISMVTVKLKQGIDASSWISNFNLELEKSTPEIKAISWMDHLIGDIYRKSMSLLGIFDKFVTIVVVFISVLSVMNTMVKIVKERTREIGTFLSLGFHRYQVLGIFLQEAFFLAVFGCIIGALSASVITALINAAEVTYKAGLFSEPVPFRITFQLGLYFFSLGFLILITLLTSFISCRSTIRKKIVDCLGHV